MSAVLLSDAERGLAAKLIIGRLFRLASRPERAGDAAEYSRLRGMLMDIGPASGPGLATLSAPSYAHDYSLLQANPS